MIARRAAALCAVALAGCSMPWQPEPSAVLPVAGTKWVGVDEGGRIDPKNLPRMEFTNNGRMAGFTGCNNMSAAYTETRGVVTFGPVAATKRFCAGIEGEIEERVMRAVGLSSLASRKDGRLVVTGPDGARYDFVPAPQEGSGRP